MNKGNNKITELRTIFQRESQNSSVYKQTKSVNNRKTKKKNLTALNLLYLNGQTYSIESITSEWSNLQH